MDNAVLGRDFCHEKIEPMTRDNQIHRGCAGLALLTTQHPLAHGRCSVNLCGRKERERGRKGEM
jgi:hypothetical protein